jgi:hypothetical protein
MVPLSSFPLELKSLGKKLALLRDSLVLSSYHALPSWADDFLASQAQILGGWTLVSRALWGNWAWALAVGLQGHSLWYPGNEPCVYHLLSEVYEWTRQEEARKDCHEAPPLSQEAPGFPRLYPGQPLVRVTWPEGKSTSRTSLSTYCVPVCLCARVWGYSCRYKWHFSPQGAPCGGRGDRCYSFSVVA